MLIQGRKPKGFLPRTDQHHRRRGRQRYSVDGTFKNDARKDRKIIRAFFLLRFSDNLIRSFPTPTLIRDLTLGTNPFGIAYYSF